MSLRVITKEELAKILALHAKWLRGEADGLRANLSSADLRSADLRSADLSLANLRLANLSSANLSSADLRLANLRSADLSSADLRLANLRSADLSLADLSLADLSLANLRSADLSLADLSSADLSLANLRSADLSLADLSSADLSLANLSSANLSSADLRLANLRSADLSLANLTPIRDDVWAVLCCSPAEVAGLRDAIIGGRIDGSVYDGNCACLVGTLANGRRCKHDEIPGLSPNSERAAERFFMGINAGDTPETNQRSAIALEWVDQWLSNMRAAFCAPSA